MAFKFPFTNYHELNLTWVLDQLKKLFEESAENVSVIETYNGRLTAVETELPAVSENASEASRTAAAAASLAQTAKATADTAQENAIQAQGIAGQARQEAQAAQRASDAATQAAQQAQAVAQNFDGRITQAENDASQALEASRSFENRVQAAITTANNAAQTATNAQGIATRADQNAALALDTLNSQRAELERIGAEQVSLITEETESGKTEIENLAQSVLDSIPADYTELSALVDKKAPVIINSASGSIASFDDGADNMKIQKLIVNIEPLQAGSGEPSPNNIRPISGWAGAEIEHAGKNLLEKPFVYRPQPATISDCFYIKAGTYTFSFDSIGTATSWRFALALFDANGNTLRDSKYEPNRNMNFVQSILAWYWGADTTDKSAQFEIVEDCYVGVFFGGTNTSSTMISTGAQLELDSTATTHVPYIGNQISVTFPDEAGTVYGGTLTINPDRTGTLVVDRASRILNGADGSTYRNNGHTNLTTQAYVEIPDKAFGVSNMISSLFKQATSTEAVYVMTGRRSANGVEFYLPADVPNTAAGVIAWFTENPNQLVYELDAPITYHLTATEVSGILTTLYGQNNIWADTGSISVEYPVDTKLYIDDKLAELQATILENI